MQQDSETILEFNRRTDILAVRMGLNLSELPGILGFSKPSLYAYRSGKNRITQKVWLKLERAERNAAGGDEKKSPEDDFAERESCPKELKRDEPINFDSTLREDETPYRFKSLQPHCQGHEMPEGMERVLERIATALERLVEMEESKRT